MLSNDLKNFLEENKNLINDNKWEEIYNQIPSYEITTELTEMLLNPSININPLLYMKDVPSHYLVESSLSHIDLIIPDNIISIGLYAFVESDVEKVLFSNNLKFLDAGSFERTSLKEVILPDSVERIGALVFAGCNFLEKVILPKSLKELYPKIFLDSPNLKSIQYKGTIKDFNYIKTPTIFKASWISESNIESIECTDGVIEIP